MTKKEIKQYAKEHKCSIREAQRQLGGEATGNVSDMPGNVSMYDYISKKADKNSSFRTHLDGLACIVQSFFMGNLLQDLQSNQVEGSAICVDHAGWNEIATDFMQDHGVNYLPNNISTDTYFVSQLPESLKAENHEVIANSLQYWYGQSIDNEQVDFNHMVMMDGELAGTKDHNKSVSMAVKYILGPFSVLVKENFDKTTTVVLGPNYEDENTGPEFEDSKAKDTVSSIMQKVFDKFAENIHSDPYKDKKVAEQMEILNQGIARIVLPLMDKHNITGQDFRDLIKHEDTAIVDSFAIMVETMKKHTAVQ